MKKIFVLSLITFLGACGLQVEDKTNSGSNANQSLFSVGGVASGLPYKRNMQVTINGNPFTINGNGKFTFIQNFANNAAYDVDILNGPGGAYQCSLQNDKGRIPNQNVTNVLLNCTCAIGSLGVGTGTFADPYLMYTASDLNNRAVSGTLADLKSGYKQVCDLDYQDITPTVFGGGTSTNTIGAFQGSYDGDGFFILNYTALENVLSKSKLKGVFGMAYNATLKNISVSNVNLKADVNLGGHAHMGSIVGYTVQTDLHNLYAEKVTLDDNGEFYDGIGGIIGLQGPNTNNTFLTNAHATDITIHGHSSWEVGGLVGCDIANIESIEAEDVNITACAYRCGGVVGGTSFSTTSVLSDLNGINETLNGQLAVGGVLGDMAGIGMIRSGFVGTINMTQETTTLAVDNFGGVVGRNLNHLHVSDSYTSSDLINTIASLGITPLEAGAVYGTIASPTTQSAYDSSKACDSCIANPGAIASDVNSFKNGTNAALANWDFANTWCLVEGDFPRLRNVPYSVCQ